MEEGLEPSARWRVYLARGELQGGQLFGGGGLVVGGVVGEDCGAVEGAVGFGEIEL